MASIRRVPHTEGKASREFRETARPRQARAKVAATPDPISIIAISATEEPARSWNPPTGRRRSVTKDSRRPCVRGALAVRLLRSRQETSMRLPTLMRLIGRTHWAYQQYLKKRLPLRVQRILSRVARSRASEISQLVNAEYNFWRVQKPVTALLGPQYRRSRDFIEIDITYACNLNCYNCNRSCEQAPTGEHMTVEQVERFVAESVAAGKQWKRIRLLGGEPTVHKNFF